jgi:subtilase family serine protease
MIGGRIHRARLCAATLAGATLLFAGVPVTAAFAPRPSALPGLRPYFRLVTNETFSRPPTTSYCTVHYKQVCYSPLQLQTAYDMEPLYNAGLNGAGMTIAIVDAFGSPTIRADLNRFDTDFSLPPPPSFRIITPSGAVPPFDRRNNERVGWAFETSLDVEYAHAMAPGANILLVETPVDETIGTAGFPQIVHAENVLINRHLAQVISQSFGAAEQTFPNRKSLMNLRGAFQNAKAHNVTMLASSGDNGPTSGSDMSGDFFDRRVANWPASDPLVTAVGGTQLHLSNSGARTLPDNVWNDSTPRSGPEASSGGLSEFFARPPYQAGVSSIATTGRGYPDVSMSASPNGGALVNVSFPGPVRGYHIIGGTSESCPLLAGIIAIADQAAGHQLGFLNPVLYRLGSGSPGLPDITKGNTNVTVKVGSKRYPVPGYQAVRGYDLASGLGTVDGAKLIAALTRTRL